MRLGVRVDDPALLPALRARLPPASRDADPSIVDHLYSIRGGGAVPGTRARRFFLVYAGWTAVARTLDEDAALDAFESQARLDVAASADRWLFVHAGAVGWNGRAILVPAPSMHGKSRLVDALVRAGATYYSDEYAVLDEEGRVYPFAKPLGLRDESGRSRRIPAPAIGDAPLPVGLVVSTRYEAGGAWRPREAAPGEALLALLTNTVRARLAPALAMKTLARVVEGAVTLAGPRGEALEAAAAVLRALDERGKGSRAAQDFGPAAGPT